MVWNRRRPVRSAKSRHPWTRVLLWRPIQSLRVRRLAHWLGRSQFWPRREILKYQEEKVRNALAHAYTIPFWKERIDVVRTKTDISYGRAFLALMPITRKRDYIADTVERYTDPRLLSESGYGHTSGSTAKPFGFFHDTTFEHYSYAICERMFRILGNDVRYPVISIRTRERSGFAIFGYTFFHINALASIRHRLPQLIQVITSLKSDVILFGWTSWMLELARLCKEQSISLPIRGILVSGEALSDTRRHEIESAMDAPVRVLYGASEMGRLAFECPERRMHINEEWAYIEITDNDGTPLPDGSEGHIIVTLFYNPVMPFIRYDSGDRGTIGAEPCPCGRTLRTLTFRGRNLAFIKFSDGRSVPLLDVTPVFDRYIHAVQQYQLVRTGDLSFVIRAVPGPQFDALESALVEHLVRAVHPHSTYRWERVESIEDGPNGKALYFIDETIVAHV